MLFGSICTDVQQQNLELLVADVVVIVATAVATVVGAGWFIGIGRLVIVSRMCAMSNFVVIRVALVVLVCPHRRSYRRHYRVRASRNFDIVVVTSVEQPGERVTKYLVVGVRGGNPSSEILHILGLAVGGAGREPQQ